MPLVRFGIIILPDQRWQQGGRRWQRAEEYGFDHAWTYDHLGWRTLVDGPWFDAVPTLTAAAIATTRIPLGTLVASPNFRHPVSFARQLTALDDISGGRILLGLGAGAGGTSFDTRVLGEKELTPRERADRFAEFAELLDLLLRTDHVTWSGRYYSAVDARNLPGCLQQPRIPFVMAGNGRRSIAMAARLGDGWVTTGTPSQDVAGLVAIGGGRSGPVHRRAARGRPRARRRACLSLAGRGRPLRAGEHGLPDRRCRPGRGTRLHRRHRPLAPAGGPVRGRRVSPRHARRRACSPGPASWRSPAAAVR